MSGVNTTSNGTRSAASRTTNTMFLPGNFRRENAKPAARLVTIWPAVVAIATTVELKKYSPNGATVKMSA